MIKLLSFLLCVFMALPAFAQASVQNGPWSDPATWGGSVPTSGTVTIAHDVTLETVTGVVNPVIASGGALRLSRTASGVLNVDLQLLVQSGGTLDFGTVASPIPANLSHQIRFKLSQADVVNAASEPGYNPGLYSPTIPGIWALAGSTWTTHGAPLTRTWGKLAADVAPGALDVSITGDATDWPIGGEVALGQSVSGVTYNPSGSYTTQFQLEYGTIASVGAYVDGATTITLTQPLVYGRSGAGEFRAEVGLVTRNVTFVTDLDAMGDVNDVRRRTFACTRFMPGGDGSGISHTGGAQGYLAYAAFERMGFYLKDGCFPVHIHRMGDDARDLFVRGISCKHTGFRCLNLHESNGVLIEDAVSVESGNGTAFMVQNDKLGGEIPYYSQQQDHAFVHNLALATQAKHFEHRSGLYPGERERSAAGFWPGASDHEAFLGNVASTPARDGSETTGFHWPEWVVSDAGTLNRSFIANEAHSLRGAGFHSWQNRGARAHDIVGGKSWGNIEGMVHGAYGFNLQTFNGLFHDNQTGIAQGVISGFVQDSTFTGRLSSNPVPLQDAGIRFGGYNIQPHPSTPNRYVRNSFSNMRASATSTPGAAIWRNGVDCNDLETDTSWSERFCASAFVIVAENTYGANVKPKNFGWLEGPSPKIPNINSYWLDHERSLVLLRKDVDGTAGQFTPSLVNAQTFYDAESDAKATPFASLPGTINFTGLLDYRDRPYADFTLNLSYDSPPTVSVAYALTGNDVTFTPTVSADTTALEYWIDAVKVAEDSAGPFDPVTVSVEELPHLGDLLPARKYNYVYAIAKDGVTINAGCGAGSNNCWPGTPQRAYSSILEIGPELNFSEDQSAYIAQLEAQIAEKDAQIVALTAQRDTAIAERDLAEADLTTTQEDLAASQAQVAAAQASLATAIAERDALADEVEDRETAMATALGLLELTPPDVDGAKAALGAGGETPMAVAHDAVSRSHVDGAGSQSEDSFSWTHTPTGTPRGVRVATISLGSGAVEKATGVTYGGVTMTAVSGASAVSTDGAEDGRVTIWELKTNIPTGAQTVVVSRTNDVANMTAFAVTQTAGVDTETVGVVLLEQTGTLTEQNVDDGSPGTNSIRYAVQFTGHGAAQPAGANSTTLAAHDFGALAAGIVVETTAGQGSRPVGYDNSGLSDDRAVVHFAVKETSGGSGSLTLPSTVFALMGVQ